MAPSMASVPLLMKKAFCRSPGVTMASSLASAARQGSSSSWLLSAIRRIWSATAFTIFGWLTPALKMPYPPRQSIYCRPSRSWRRGPQPDHSTAANCPASVTDLR